MFFAVIYKLKQNLNCGKSFVIKWCQINALTVSKFNERKYRQISLVANISMYIKRQDAVSVYNENKGISPFITSDTGTSVYYERQGNVAIFKGQENIALFYEWQVSIAM